jgi:hypothetical protein
MSPLVSLGSFVGTMLVGCAGWWLFSDDSGPDDGGGGGDWGEVVPVPMAPCSCAVSAAKRTARTRCHRANTPENENEEVLV